MFCTSEQAGNKYLLERSKLIMLIWVTWNNVRNIVAENLRVFDYMGYPREVIRSLRTKTIVTFDEFLNNFNLTLSDNNLYLFYFKWKN